jgi:hypothetical protein
VQVKISPCAVQQEIMRFQVLTSASIKTSALLDVAQCSFVEVDRRFRGAYHLRRPDDEAIRTCKTSIYFNETTRRCIPESCYFQQEFFRIKVRETGFMQLV